MNRLRPYTLSFAVAGALLLTACGGGEPSAPPAPPASDSTGAAAPATQAAPADAFLAALAQHCGQAFAGEIETDVPAQPDSAFAGQQLVMHVRECADGEIKVPFHVGEDRSRTWVITRTDTGLRLKHDHRHEDGSEDVLTMYGGDTDAPGTAQRQEFPVDADSVALFEREGLVASVVNVWAMEIEPGETFVYELARPGTDRLFRVRFDLTREIEAPPAPWGHE
ncbi:hypothetical protein [Coralloluteibacterium thermophilus]|uniref:Lipoprotein n=1 Tax=Coralloluteibacterium thermophilum TaxID=2707049 RepID=A0ABV9NIH5_9GAMM